MDPRPRPADIRRANCQDRLDELWLLTKPRYQEIVNDLAFAKALRMTRKPECSICAAPYHGADKHDGSSFFCEKCRIAPRPIPCDKVPKGSYHQRKAAEQLTRDMDFDELALAFVILRDEMMTLRSEIFNTHRRLLDLSQAVDYR